MNFQKWWSIVIMVLVLAFSPFSEAISKDRTLSNGFSVSASLGFVNTDFGTPALISHDDFDYANMFGLQIGSRWYFNPTETWGIGLMVNWFDVSKVNANSDDVKVYTFDFSAFELGPVATYALSDKMAVDGFYNLRPTVLASSDVKLNKLISGDVGNSMVGYGFTHTIGAAFRWNVLSVGIETVFGNVNISEYELTDYEDEFEELDSGDKIINNKRIQIVLGIKL